MGSCIKQFFFKFRLDTQVKKLKNRLEMDGNLFPNVALSVLRMGELILSDVILSWCKINQQKLASKP